MWTREVLLTCALAAVAAGAGAHRETPVLVVHTGGGARGWGDDLKNATKVRGGPRPAVGAGVKSGAALASNFAGARERDEQAPPVLDRRGRAMSLDMAPNCIPGAAATVACAGVRVVDAAKNGPFAAIAGGPSDTAEKSEARALVGHEVARRMKLSTSTVSGGPTCGKACMVAGDMKCAGAPFFYSGRDGRTSTTSFTLAACKAEALKDDRVVSMLWQASDPMCRLSWTCTKGEACETGKKTNTIRQQAFFKETGVCESDADVCSGCQTGGTVTTTTTSVLPPGGYVLNGKRWAECEYTGSSFECPESSADCVLGPAIQVYIGTGTDKTLYNSVGTTGYGPAWNDVTGPNTPSYSTPTQYSGPAVVDADLLWVPDVCGITKSTETEGKVLITSANVKGSTCEPHKQAKFAGNAGAIALILAETCTADTGWLDSYSHDCKYYVDQGWCLNPAYDITSGGSAVGSNFPPAVAGGAQGNCNACCLLAQYPFKKQAYPSTTVLIHTRFISLEDGKAIHRALASEQMKLTLTGGKHVCESELTERQKLCREGPAYKKTTKCCECSSAGCPAGSYSTEGKCADCGVGYYCTGGSARAQCKAGTHQASTTASASTSCKACRAGYSCGGFTESICKVRGERDGGWWRLPVAVCVGHMCREGGLTYFAPPYCCPPPHAP